MADYHIGFKSVDNRYAEVYVHLPVPDIETVAGQALGAGVEITYQDAMAAKLDMDYPDGFISGVGMNGVGRITPEELALIVGGELTEKHIHFRFDSLDIDNGARRDQIEAGNDNMTGVAKMMIDITDDTSDLFAEVLSPLKWWGYGRDIPEE